MFFKYIWIIVGNISDQFSCLMPQKDRRILIKKSRKNETKVKYYIILYYINTIDSNLCYCYYTILISCICKPTKLFLRFLQHFQFKYYTTIYKVRFSLIPYTFQSLHFTSTRQRTTKTTTTKPQESINFKIC